MSAWKDRDRDRDQDQVGDPLCDESNKTEYHILLEPGQTSGNRLAFGNGSKKLCKEDSMLETSAKHNNLHCNVENRSIINRSQDFMDLKLDLDTWPDHDSVVTGRTSNLNDASFLNPVGSIMTNSHSGELLHKKFPSYFRISRAAPCSNLSMLDGEPELFGHDEEGNERFLNYDLANIEDFDNVFRNSESFCGNEMVHSTDIFLKTSGDVISNTFLSVSLPDFPTSMVQFSDKDSSSHQLVEHSDEKVNTLDTEKEDVQNQTPMLVKEVKGKDMSFQDLNCSWSSEKQSMSYCKVECSTMSSHIHLQSQTGVQGSSSCDVMYADYEYHPFQFPGFPFQPQSHEISYKADEAGQKSTILTSREKIEKLSWRQFVQDQYSQLSITDDITSHDQNTINEYNRKFASSEVSSMLEQDQSKMLSSLINERFTEEAIYYQLQESKGKLEMKARVAISNSLFRLARSAMERQGACGKTWNGKNMEEDEISAGLDLQWQSRISGMPNSEVVTNPMDRIVAHLLFHDAPGSYQLPFGDANAPTVMSM